MVYLEEKLFMEDLAINKIKNVTRGVRRRTASASIPCELQKLTKMVGTPLV